MDKALSISEKEKIFRKQFITTKEQLLETILKVKAKNDSNANFDFFHSSAYYSTLSSLLEEFYETTCKIVLFNNLEPFWGYSFMIDSEGITLHLSHTPSLKLDEKQEKIVSSASDQTFSLLHVNCKMLTVEEYAELYNVENVTVRQWIRRGKIKTAKKIGGEWRIPQLTEQPKRGYQGAKYDIGETAVFNDNYAYLSDFSFADCYRDLDDKSVFHISLYGEKDNQPIFKDIECNNSERESIELALIENVSVKCLSEKIANYWEVIK